MRGSQEPGGLVLIVEDNRNISEMVGEYLESRGFEVDYAADGLDGYRLASENNYDVIVLDLMLPRLDGIEVCKRLREEARKSTPVLMLTARDTLDEKLTGLSAGADDYLTKPFAFSELLARIEALLRRSTGAVRTPIAPPAERFGDIEVDRAARTVTRGGVPVYLAPMEFELLLALLQRRGAVATRQELMREVWGHSAVVVSRTVDTHIAELRRKLEHDAAEPQHILTVRKAGYRLER